MVKRREPKALTTEPSAEQIEAFVAGAEDGPLVSSTALGSGIKSPVLNQNAIRDYKTISVPFNEYEYQQLEIASQLSGRTKLNFIRYAMLKFAKEMQVAG
jgi:hypothetical protein